MDASLFATEHADAAEFLGLVRLGVEGELGTDLRHDHKATTLSPASSSVSAIG